MAQHVVIPGHPVPHVRMTQRSKHTDPQASRYLAYKDEIGLRANLAAIIPIAGAVKLTVYVYCRERKWDASNVLKAIEDGLNGIAYEDDWQITDAHIVIREQFMQEYVSVWIEAIEGVAPCRTSSAPSPESFPKPSIAYPKGSISTASRSSGSKTGA